MRVTYQRAAALGQWLGVHILAEMQVQQGSYKGEPCALKAFSFTSDADGDWERLAARELLLLDTTQHENVVKLLGAVHQWKPDGSGLQVLVLVMELVPQGNVRKLLHNPASAVAQSLRLRLRIAREIRASLHTCTAWASCTAT
jgi:serine/threonine protein kinase